MSISTKLPQVTALKMAIEKKTGLPMLTHSDFTLLAEKVQADTGAHISDITFERLWNYSTRKSEATSSYTLDALSKYAGFASWREFLQKSADSSSIESEFITKGEQINAASLSVGAEIHLAWLPDRQITIKCIDSCRFEVMEVLNSSGIRVGDTFSAMVFQKGRELYMDNYLCAEEENCHTRYVVGQKNGLTSVEIME